MKNYGLQVKEIPIIFRGTIDGAGSATDPIYTRRLAFIEDEGGGYYLAEGINMNISSYDNLWIEVGDDYYANLPKWEFNGKVGFGAPLTESGGVDFSTYSFLVYQMYSTTALIASQTADEKVMRIWDQEPAFFAPTNKTFEADLTGNGQINHFRARFACGENGTLHLRPYVILNGNIRIDLCNFAQGGDQYIAGDNEEIEFDCYVPIETHATAYVEAENTGEYPSLVDAAMTVQYEDFIESESIVGYEGVNLRRGRR